MDSYSTEDLDQIGAGSYTVVITDENGCDVTTTVVLEETQPMQVVHDQSLDTIYAGYGVSCNGATDGSIDITVSGGTGVYTYVTVEEEISKWGYSLLRC